MDRIVETTEMIKKQGNSWAVFIKSEAEALGLEVGDMMCVLCTTADNRENALSMLYGNGPYMFFIAVSEDDGKIGYDIRKSLSERSLRLSLDFEPVAILGPVLTLGECMRLKDRLERCEPEPSEKALKECFKRFLSDSN